MAEVHGRYTSKMCRAEIIDYFSETRFTEHPSFRALCNVFKALCLEEAMRVWRSNIKGMAVILDLGCGKGGDLGKFLVLRPKRLIGIDGSAQCVDEARTRYATLVASGKGHFQADFICMDLCHEALELPVDEMSVDVVFSGFFMQYAAETFKGLKRCLEQIYKCLKPGGVFVCTVPDGDRILPLLRAKQRENDIARFGHFVIVPCEATTYGDDEPSCGQPYRFALAEDQGCTEYIIQTMLFTQLLASCGFEPCSDIVDTFGIDAHQLLSKSQRAETLVNTMMRGVHCSHVDWLTLGFFKVFQARRKL